MWRRDYHSTGRSAAEFSLRFHAAGPDRLIRASAGFLRSPPEGFCEVPLIRPRGNLWIAEADKADRLRAIYATESRQSPPDAGPLPLISIAEALEMVPFLNPGWPAAAIPDADC